MKSSFLTFLIVVASFMSVSSQSDINSGFGEANDAQSTMSISIGQTFSNSTGVHNVGSLHFGVQQPDEYTILTLINEEVSGVSLDVYPTLVTHELTIKNNSSGIKQFSFVDDQGVIVVESTPLDDVQKVDMSAFASGIYFIIITTPSQSFSTYKIIKK